MRATGQWITLKADSYEAQVSQSTLSAYPGSLLANLVEMELAQPSPMRPCIRLDCCEAVAREVVSLLRQRGSYTPPSDQRLLRALQHQLDFLGIPMTPEARGQEVVLVPSYALNNYYDEEPAGSHGMFVYSSSTRGWANIAGQDDQRPKQLQAANPAESLDCLASVLRAERTGAGEDLAFVVSNCFQDNSTAIMINSSFKCKDISVPRQHSIVIASGMAAAQGKLFLLGGEEHPQWEGPSPNFPFEVFDPHLNTWHQAAPPHPQASLHNHTLVANQAEGMLLALGGIWRACNGAPTVQDHVLMYDVTGGSWSVNPSGCKYPGGAGSSWVSAVSVDPHTIVVLGSSADAKSARVDLLDLRTWRWRSGCGLKDDLTYAMGVVEYEGRVLAMGGREPRTDPYGNMVPFIATRKVRAYDHKADVWSELPELPRLAPEATGVCDACPVVMRVASVLH